MAGNSLQNVEFLKARQITKLLQISDKKPLALGSSRMVFMHPDERRFILKMPRVRGAEAKRSRHAEREQRVYRQFTPEMQVDPNPPIARFYGKVETDLGTADVFEAIYGPKGYRLGPTLKRLFARKYFDETKLGLLNTLIQKLEKWEIPVTDMYLANFVDYAT